MKSAKKAFRPENLLHLGISTCGDIVDVDANAGATHSHTQTSSPVLHIAMQRVPCAPWAISWDDIFVPWASSFVDDIGLHIVQHPCSLHSPEGSTP